MENGNYGIPGQKIQQQSISPMMEYQMIFPEVYYKLQPYILMACDRLDLLGTVMPTQDMIDSISESIYNDISIRDPDLAKYLSNQASEDSTETIMELNRLSNNDPPAFGWRFRRRGLPVDLIDILLLSELFGRRRRYYY